MNADEYLTCLQAQLKGLSSEKQKELIEEIAAHLAEGQADPQLGADPAERAERLKSEMGAPEDLGRRMKNIHRHTRWMDYFLVVLPALLIPSLVNIALTYFLSPDKTGQSVESLLSFWSFRISALTYFALLLVGIRRYRRLGEAGLAVYWLVEIFWGVVSLCLREQRIRLDAGVNLTSSGVIETIFWLAVLVGLGVGFVWIMVRERDLLLLTLGLLPLTVAVGNLVTGQMLLSGSLANGYELPGWRVGYLGPTQIAFIIWPALFFLFKSRAVRWLGLLTNAVPLALMNLVASIQYPTLILLWSLPMALVAAGWLIDMINKKPGASILAG
jgi:hypothetical protein